MKSIKELDQDIAAIECRLKEKADQLPLSEVRELNHKLVALKKERVQKRFNRSLNEEIESADNEFAAFQSPFTSHKLKGGANHG